MAATEEKTGSEVLAIAHNGNLSNGTMFPMVEAFGKKLDKSYVETRAKWERLYEVTQMKGDGETHPFLSPNDEFADFERWDKANLAVTQAKHQGHARIRVRALGAEERPGARSEAGHESLQVRHDRQHRRAHRPRRRGGGELLRQGHRQRAEPGAAARERSWTNPKIGVKIMDWEVSSSGYAAVWATENTREAIFDAMQRRETYATTGPRMVVRFFGGCDFEPKDARNRDAGGASATPRACRWAAT